MSAGAAEVKHGLKQRKRAARQVYAETDGRSGHQFKCSARLGEWSSMLKSGTVKYLSEEVKQLMHSREDDTWRAFC